MRGRMFTGVGLLLVISATLLLAPLLGRVLSRAAVSLIYIPRIGENAIAALLLQVQVTLWSSSGGAP